MFDYVVSRWERLLTWGKWVCGIAGVFAIASVGSAIHERHFFSALFENFIAFTLHWGLVIGSFAAGIWGGMKIAEKSHRAWLGWISGFIIFGVISVGLGGAFERLFGVGWLLREMMRSSDCYVDWDGRSNPIVCD